MDKNKKTVILVLFCAAALGGAAFGAVQKKETEAEKTIFAMDTVMTLSAVGTKAGEAVEGAVKEIQRLDSMLSTGNENSLVCQLNENGRVKAPEEMQELFLYSQQLYESTDGCFDITVYPVMKLWGFATGEYHVPEDKELEAVKDLVGMEQLGFDEASGELMLQKEGMAVDFGGIAKGYTSSRVMDIFEEYGVKRGIVSLGGNVHTLGTKKDGTYWKIAIRDPENTDSYLGIAEVADEAVITSGGYERYFEENGETYHHIIDPYTCAPADSGLVSVTIVSRDGTLADGLSTSLYIMGLRRAEDYWQEHADEFEAVFVSEDGEITITEGLEDRFTSEREYVVIRRE